MASIEYESIKDKPKFDEAISMMAREDNSLKFEENKDTTQLVVSGLGELHLEVMRDRLESDFGVRAKLGKMRVAYREGISSDVTIE